jgi:hypothetical protein
MINDAIYAQATQILDAHHNHLTEEKYVAKCYDAEICPKCGNTDKAKMIFSNWSVPPEDYRDDPDYFRAMDCKICSTRCMRIDYDNSPVPHYKMEDKGV